MQGIPKERRLFKGLRSVLETGMGPWPSIYRNLLHWSIIALPIGVIAGLGAAGFMFLWQESTDFFLGYIVGINYPEPGGPVGSIVTWSSSSPRILLLPLVMGAGGLIVGLIAERFAPEIEGHGTDESIRAFHQKAGKVRTRVAPLKMIATAITLGTGGSGGREGPTAQIGSSFGSWWADTLHLSSKERRISMAVGLGAGVSAIFKAPLGGAIYGAEIFYMTDFEPEVIFPSIMASVVSYSIFGVFYGFNPLFTAPSAVLTSVPWSVEQLPLYAILGALCAVVGVGFVLIFRHTQMLFQSAPISRRYLPAFGGLAAGAVVLGFYYLSPWGNHIVALSSLNVGYGFVQAIMFGEFTSISSLLPVLVVVLALAMVLRMIATSFTVASGGSAGLFGTSVVVGALLGSTVGVAFAALFPGLVQTDEISVFAIVGMMAFFGGISKAPLAVLVMVVEMVASYSILIPAMLSIFIAYAATGKYHIYAEQVDTRLDSPSHRDEAIDFALRGIRAVSIMDTKIAPLDPHLTVAQALADPAVEREEVIPVIRDGVWYGMVRMADLTRVSSEEAETTTVYDLLSVPAAVVSEEASVAEAYQAMVTHSTDVVVVISTGVEMRFRGLLTQARVLGLIERGVTHHD